MTNGIIQQVFKESIKFWSEGNNPASRVFKKELELLQQELIEKIKQESSLNGRYYRFISLHKLIGDNKE